MRISLICKELSSHGIVGASVVSQARFFMQRGDQVRIYTEQCAEVISTDIHELTRVISFVELLQGDAYFNLSDVLIYHYAGQYDLVESIRGIDRGLVVLHYHSVLPPPLWGSIPGIQCSRRDFEGIAVIHYADWCMVDSPFDQEQLTANFKYDPARVFVLPTPVAISPDDMPAKDDALVKRFDLDNKHLLIYAGDLTSAAQIDELLDVLNEVRRSVPATKLMLAVNHATSRAEPAVVSSAQDGILRQGLAGEALIILGPEDICQHYLLADVYVTQHVYDGNGASLAQAMACGVPAVAINAGANAWVVGDERFICAPGDRQAFVNQVVALLKNDVYRSEAVGRALEQSRRFGRQSYHDRLEAFIARAIVAQLPPLPVDTAEAVPPRGQLQVPTPAEPLTRPGLRELAALESALQRIESHTDIALRNYKVQSRIPILGRIIVWMRRNMTSHVREPYLDVMVERQVACNREVVSWMKHVSSVLTVLVDRQSNKPDNT